MRHRSEFWRLSLFTALGLCPNACGGRTEDNSNTQAQVEGRPTTEVASDETSGVTTDPVTRPSRPTSPASTQIPTAPTPTNGPNGTGGTTTTPTIDNPPATTPNPSTTGGTTGEELDGGAAEPLPAYDSGVSRCGASTPELVEREPTGVNACDNGLRHRPSAEVSCSSKVPREEPVDQNGQYPGECTQDSDCTQDDYGFCAHSGGQAYELVCHYGCLTDSDCEADQLCVCGDPVGQCVASNCKEDADCGDGLLCAYWGETTGIGCPVTPHFVCQTHEDECAVDADCSQDGFGRRCSAAGGTRKCVEIEGFACGRPFLVTGSERLAALVRGGVCTSSPIAQGVAADSRVAIGEHWAAVGLMEHASIAAFARFSLQLLHVGAPHALLVAAQHAMLDETAHAEACFDIASRVLGTVVGAGPLAMDQALAETTLEDIVRLTVREGCIGETVAAMEAAEAAALATEPHVRETLSKIQSDELRHAELAWRFVAWALEQDATSTLRAVIQEELVAARRELAAQTSNVPTNDSALEAFGVLSEGTRRALRREALLQVIVPCAAELLRVTAPSHNTPEPAISSMA